MFKYTNVLTNPLEVRNWCQTYIQLILDMYSTDTHIVTTDTLKHTTDTWHTSTDIPHTFRQLMTNERLEKTILKYENNLIDWKCGWTHKIKTPPCLHKFYYLPAAKWIWGLAFVQVSFDHILPTVSMYLYIPIFKIIGFVYERSEWR